MEKKNENASQLKLVISRGWISAWELSMLKTGDQVMGSSTKPGQDAELCLGSSILAQASLVIIKDCLAARISSFERELPLEPEPERGSEILELLPFEISIPGPLYEMEELSGVGIGSFVSLEFPFDSPKLPSSAQDFPQMEFLIAGRKFASGPVVVEGEKFGIMVAALYRPFKWDGEIRSTGAVIKIGKGSPTEKRPRFYDFRRPDRFSGHQLKVIEHLHQRFIETLTEFEPQFSDYEITAIDQMSYSEFLEDNKKKSPESGPVIISSSFDIPARGYERERKENTEQKILLKPGNTMSRISEESKKILKYYNEQNLELQKYRNILVFSDSVRLEELTTVLARSLRSAWRLLSDVEIPVFALEKTVPILRSKYSREKLQEKDGKEIESPLLEGQESGIFEWEMVLVVKASSGNENITIVYSANALYPLWKVLERYGRW